MKTSEFIRRAATGQLSKNPRSGEQRCSSVVWDGTHVYSYGRHYPLLIAIPAKDGRMIRVCNDAGYSSTTSRHISYARRFADYSVEIPRTFAASKALTPEGIAEAARDEIKERTAYIVETLPKITANPRYTGMRHRYDEACKRVEQLNALIAAIA